MARVDYYGIAKAIQSQLQADSNLADVTVLVEEELTMSRGNVVIIYLDRREAPDDLQTLSAGTRTRFNLFFSIWCFHFGFEKALAIEARDDLLGKVELALMSDPTFSNNVSSSWITGGDFDNGPLPDGVDFMAGAEVQLLAQKQAIS